MSDILKKIRRERERTLAEAASAWPEAVLMDSIRAGNTGGPRRGFIRALSGAGGPHLIAELKKASPSAGLIRPDFDPERIARAYEKGGAKALSVLTEPTFFRGDLEYLRIARSATRVPVLRKDFIFDRYQLFEALESGADAILLIVAMLSKDELAGLYAESHKLGLDVLIEVHSEEELKAAMAVKPRMVGINNRNLKTMKVDIETTFRLRRMIPSDILVVSESGIKTPSDVARLRESGVNAMLVGESLMRQPDPGKAARELLSG